MQVWPVIVSDKTIEKLDDIRGSFCAFIKNESHNGSNVDYERDLLNYLDAFIDTCKDTRP